MADKIESELRCFGLLKKHIAGMLELRALADRLWQEGLVREAEKLV